MPTLPRQIHEGGFPHILDESVRIEKLAIDRGGKDWTRFDSDRKDQQVFLDTFRKTFSVKNSIRAAGVEYRFYQTWRAKSIYFVKEFNSIIEQWHDDIYVSAATRARGNLRVDPETESGYAEDADGLPIYFGGDPNLTKMFLKATHPEQFNEKYDVNLQGGLNNTTTPLDKEEYAKVRQAMLESDDC